MVYHWGAAWVPGTAKRMLVDDKGKPLRNLGWSNEPEFGPKTVKAEFVIPDIMSESVPEPEMGLSLSVSEKAAAILKRWGDEHIELTPQNLFWPDGTPIEKRSVITRCTSALPLAASMSRYEQISPGEIRLKNIDDALVFDGSVIAPPHIWKSRPIHYDGFFASDDCAGELLRANLTGLYARPFAEHRDGKLTGPPYRPEEYVFALHCIRHAISEGPVDGALDKICTIDPLPEQLLQLGSPRAVSLGLPVRREHMPTRWQFGSKERNLPGFMGWGTVLTVSTTFRQIIETFDPGRHQFFPLDYVTRKGDLIQKRFLLVVCALIDSLDRERSGPAPSKLWRQDDLRSLVVDRAKVAGTHLWLDPYFGHNNTCFVSYELARALESENPKGLLFQRYPLNAGL